MITYLVLMIKNSKEKTIITETVFDNTTDANTTEVFGNTEFHAINDFRTFNNYKTMTDNLEEYNLTISSWGVALMLNLPYNSSLYDVFFYINARSDINSETELILLPLSL